MTKSKVIRVTEKEHESLRSMADTYNSVVEACNADPNTLEGRDILHSLFETAKGVQQVLKKLNQ